MDFIKKNYEKLVLGVVLLAVAGVAVYLMYSVTQVREDLSNALQQFDRAKKKEVAAVDLTTNAAVLSKVAKPAPVVLAGLDHYTFNPITWARAANGRLEPSKPRPDIGAAGLVYLKSHDLDLEIAFADVAGTPDSPRYQFSVRREYEKSPSNRRAMVESIPVGAESKAQIFKVLEARGPKENPTEFLCELVSTREQFILSRTKSFRKTMGYAADLRYDAAKREFSQKRAGETLNLSGVTYKIVAIEKDELVVSAPNSERTTVLKSSAQ